jgi:hypothetical protein
VIIEENIAITTLNVFYEQTDISLEDRKISIKNRFYILLNKLGFLTTETIIPEWVSEITFYNDEIYTKQNESIEVQIEGLNKEIEKNNIELQKNNRYKSILYETGKNLSNQINAMLEIIFEIKSSDFIDTCEEDYRIKFNDITFIIETKGLNNQVGGKNVSDAYDHLVIYEDELEKKGIKEETKCLFFTAYERLLKPSEREKINERQITIAKRNKILIIDTPTFYRIFEDFIQKEIDKDTILNILKTQLGQIVYNKTKTNECVKS